MKPVGRAWALVAWAALACGSTGKSQAVCPDPSQVAAGVACVEAGLTCAAAAVDAPGGCYGATSTCTCKQGQWSCQTACSDAGVCAPGLPCAPGDTCVSLDPATLGETLSCDPAGHYALAHDAAAVD